MKTRILTFKPEIENIIRKCEVCYTGMVDEENMPYVIPMNFGYHNNNIYLHSAQTGKKISILTKNPNVCVVFSTDHELRYVNEHVACSWGMKYRSILAYGKVEFIEDYDEKITALNCIMKNYSEKEFTYKQPAIIDVKVYKVVVDKFEGRVHGY